MSNAAAKPSIEIYKPPFEGDAIHWPDQIQIQALNGEGDLQTITLPRLNVFFEGQGKDLVIFPFSDNEIVLPAQFAELFLKVMEN